MSVSSTEHLDKLAFILYDRPSGRNIIGYAIEHIEQLRADLATQQGCCDGAAAQDAHVRREREEHRAEIERLREENERLRRFAESVSSSGPDDDNIVWVRLDLPATGGHAAIAVARPISKNIALQFEAIRREALEGKP